ncbi:MAG TPA: hypothetical protein VFR93_03740 [Candidatus Limnocylindrales bacterium]|nr:hypothetical protein [Candidatus Limnocylindrales bacterium]
MIVVVVLVLAGWFAGINRPSSDAAEPTTVTVYLCLGAKPGDAILQTYEMTSPCPSGFLQTGQKQLPASAAPSG